MPARRRHLLGPRLVVLSSLAVLAALVVLQLPGLNFVQSMQAVLNGPLSPSNADLLTHALVFYLFLSLAVATSITWSRALQPQHRLLGRTTPSLQRLQASLLLTSCVLLPVLFSIIGTPSFAVVTLLSCLAIVAPFTMVHAPKKPRTFRSSPIHSAQNAAGGEGQTSCSSAEDTPPGPRDHHKVTTTSEDSLLITALYSVPRTRERVAFPLLPSPSEVVEQEGGYFTVRDPRHLIALFQNAMTARNTPVPEGLFSFMLYENTTVDFTQPVRFHGASAKLILVPFVPRAGNRNSAFCFDRPTSQARHDLSLLPSLPPQGAEAVGAFSDSGESQTLTL